MSSAPGSIKRLADGSDDNDLPSESSKKLRPDTGDCDADVSKDNEPESSSAAVGKEASIETGIKETDEAEKEEKLEDLSEDPLPTESNCGITEYISSLPGFSAVFKEHYWDFLVNEIDSDGKIVRLTDLSLPENVEDKAERLELDMLSSDEVQKIEDLASGMSHDPVSINVTDKDKDTRRKIHEAIRQNFVGLESTTQGTESSKSIVVSKETSKTRKNHRGKNYTHFVLYKENIDTMEAVNRIASMLRFTPKVLSYAGTKDRRAKTTQAFSAYRVDARKLLGLNKRDYKIKIGNIRYLDKEIRLGDLSGNYFIIILRRVDGEDQCINKAMESLSTNGFINYFGMQRFGTTSIPTYAVGKALLSGKWKDAVDLILYPKYEEDEDGRHEALKIWSETGDAKAALAVLYYKNGIEGSLLKGLASHNQNDYVSALNSMPRNVRLMYIHSYQSYIWNKVVSRRLKRHHMKVLPGDLIISESSARGCAPDGVSEGQFSKVTPRYATAEDMNNPDLIYDVVLPLAGHSIIFPDNEIKGWYEEFMKEDGMDFSNLKSNVKEYSLTGAYRKILVRPAEVKWKIIRYSDSSIPLALSDYDILQDVALAPEDEDGEFKAVRLELSLPTSSYATMALREVLKVDTSIGTQIAMCTDS